MTSLCFVIAQCYGIVLNIKRCIHCKIISADNVLSVYSLFFQNLALNVCNEKADWLENTPGAVTQDFITQKQALNEALAPIWTKLSEPRKYYQYHSYLIYLCIFKKLLLRLAVVKLSKQFF